MYPLRPPGNDYRLGGPSGYGPTWNLYDGYTEYISQNRQVNGSWDWPDHTMRNHDWYQVPRAGYENTWNYGDIGGYTPNSYQDIYAIPRPCIDTQPNNLRPRKWWHQDIQLPAEPLYSGYHVYNPESFFRHTAYDCTGLNARPNHGADSSATTYLGNTNEPVSSVATEPTCTPLAEAGPKEDCSQEQLNITRDSYVDVHESPEISTPRDPSPYTQTELQKCIQDLRKERLHLRRERRSFHQLNTQFRSLFCSFKTVVNRQHEGGCRCPTSKSKKKFTDHGTRGKQPGHQCDHEDNVNKGNVSINELPDYQRVSADGSPALDRYNAAWNALRRADVNTPFASKKRFEISWPTRDLQYTSLGRYDLYNQHYIYSSRTLPPEIMHDFFQLQKWNTFCFFVEAFGFKAYYAFEPVVDSPSLGRRHGRTRKINVDGEQSRLVFHIDILRNDMSRARRQLEALKAQMQQEKLRWHPDRWRLSMRQAVGTLVDEKMESAKAVWGAIIEVSQACDAHLRAGSQ